MPTHGSMTKAGKVRNQTPKIAPQANKKPIPKTRNLRNYTKRFINQRNEDRFTSRRRGRRR